jgi:hypothetical protein
MTEITVTAVPSHGVVVLEIDDKVVVPLQPAAAMTAGLLMAKASIQVAAKTAQNVEGLAIMLAGIDEMLEVLVPA